MALTKGEDTSNVGQRQSPKAASFVRPTKASDKTFGFLEALKKRYAPEAESTQQFSVSSKAVDEIGFEKIRNQLASLEKLPVVGLHKCCITGIKDHDEDDIFKKWLLIKKQDLRISDLDLSSNLLEQWLDVVGICSALSQTLRVLTLNCNRFRDFRKQNIDAWNTPFLNITELSLCSTYLSWQDFPSLTTLRLAENGLGSPTGPLPAPTLRFLDLSSNQIQMLSELDALVELPSLDALILRGNQIRSLMASQCFSTVTFLDLTQTELPSVNFLNPIPKIFPSLTALLTTDTPIARNLIERSLTIATIATLRDLNYSPISATYRRDAEIYFVSIIIERLNAATTAPEAEAIKSQYPTFETLCQVYEMSHLLSSKSAEKDQPVANTLATRMIRFTFYITTETFADAKSRDLVLPGHDEPLLSTAVANSPRIEKVKLLPRAYDIYNLKGYVGRLFCINPMACRLIWETQEWDPVIKDGDDDGWSVDEDQSDEGGDRIMSGGDVGAGERSGGGESDGREWTRREVELVDGTRNVESWLEEATEATVRMEVRDL
ncbi:hypothetical protein ACLMJK_003993 [Lecanora helva]